jgi:hypothetical protein
MTHIYRIIFFFLTGVPKVLGQMSLYFSSAKIGFGKIKNTYSESTSKELSNYVLKFFKIMPCLGITGTSFDSTKMQPVKKK